MFATKGMDKEINVMRALEGIVTTQSTHAAGLVVTDEPIYTYAPCHTTSEDRDRYVLSMDKKKVEKHGLIKHDFLGLKTLTVIRKTLARIKKSYNVDIDIWNLPKDDKKDEQDKEEKQEEENKENEQDKDDEPKEDQEKEEIKSPVELG